MTIDDGMERIQMKLSPSVNACLWGCLAIVAFAGIPFAILWRSPLGIIPALGSGLVGLALVSFAYEQWRKQTIKINFFKAIPPLAAGIAVAVVLSYLLKVTT